MNTRTLHRKAHHAKPLRCQLPDHELAAKGAARLATRARNQEKLARQLGDSDDADSYAETAAHLEKIADQLETGELEFDAQKHAHLKSEGLKG